jgi:hypothetical protein
MDHATLLISAYCDNDLSNDEGRQLVSWLREDPANVDRLAREFLWHSWVCDFMRQEQLQSSAWSKTLDGEAIPVSDQQPTRLLPTKPNKLGRWTLSVMAVALSVALCVAVYLSLAADHVVAQISSSNSAAVISDGEQVLAGALLHAGETLRVDRGNLIVTFECGTKVRVDAPAEFEVEGRSVGRLTRGTASARIPTQAIGFSIRTPLADIVDLGTEFRVDILDENRLDLHVFDGLVEVRLDKSFDHVREGPLRISEGRSTRFDAAANKIMTLKYDESLREEY